MSAPKPSDIAWQDESGYDPLTERVRFTTDFARASAGLFAIADDVAME